MGSDLDQQLLRWGAAECPICNYYSDRWNQSSFQWRDAYVTSKCIGDIAAGRSTPKYDLTSQMMFRRMESN